MNQRIKWTAAAVAAVTGLGLGGTLLAEGFTTTGTAIDATISAQGQPAPGPASSTSAGQPGTSKSPALSWSSGTGGIQPTPKPPAVFDLSDRPQQHKAGKDAAVNTGYTTGLKGCQLECIKKATVQASATSAEFTVETHVPTRMWVIITGKAPVNSGTTKMTHWTTTITGLEPGTSYDVTIVATDADDHTRAIYGSFSTQRRMATVVFDKIHVIGDADKGANRGEIEFYFDVDGKRVGHRDSQKIASGSTISLRVGRGKPGTLVPDATEKLHLQVSGLEDDTKVLGCSPNPLRPTAEQADRGEGGPCWDAASAMAGIDLTPGKKSTAFSDTMIIATTQHKLKFAVTVQVKVWYE